MRLKNPFNNDRPGQTWYIRFLNRNPEIALKRAEGINKARVQVTQESIRIWFRELEAYLRETGNADILQCPDRIFNGDESGFSLCPKTGKVLGPKGRNQIKTNNDKENITVLITFNAKGQICPPLVVFPYIRPPKAVVDNMPAGWVLGKSVSGCMRGDIYFEYITNEFNNWVDNMGIKKPILLLVDGHKSHMSLVLSSMCNHLGIILYALPPNTTQIPPADVSVFAPLKASWNNIVTEFTLNHDVCAVTKVNFSQFFEIILQDPNLENNIINGFRSYGLHPFNADAVDYTECVQNTMCTEKSFHLNPNNITNADLDATRKVLKHIKPILKKKNINISIILKEMRKLRQKHEPLGASVVFKQ